MYFFLVRINFHNLFTCIIENRTSFSCYRPILTFNLGCTKAEPTLLFILEGGLFWLIVRVIFTIFNINIPFFIYPKQIVVFVHLAFHRCSTNLLDVELIEENKLGWCQRRKLFFVVPGWFMLYFRLLPFVINEQYGEGDMRQAVVFVNIFFVFALTLSPLEVCWAWSTIASLVDTLPLSTYPHSLFLVVFSEFFLF